MGRLKTISYSVEQMMPIDGDSLEKENMWLWFMDLVMLPSQTLSNRQHLVDGKLRRIPSYLSYAKATPFLLPEQFQSSFGSIKVFLGDLLEHVLGQLHVSVLVLAVGIPGISQISNATTRKMARKHAKNPNYRAIG